VDTGQRKRKNGKAERRPTNGGTKIERKIGEEEKGWGV